jgi:beta-glucosidase
MAAPSPLFRFRHSVLTLLVPFALSAGVAAETPGAAAIDARVRELLSQMTVEEKVGQLVQYSSREDMTGPASGAAIAPAVAKGGVGSLLNVYGATETRKWQEFAVRSSRLHLPLIFGLDVIHGYRTIFPNPLGSAASWDLAQIERAERIAATESAAAGVHWTFAPMVDVARDPRWGRISEGAGEDPFLGAAIARARVRGFQGADLAATDTILACAKHFAGYGAVQAGRDYFTTDLSERTLREVYLPPFHAAVDAGVGTLMAAFNDLDGTPCSANAFLLDRVLRQEWGFRGFVVSDWASAAEMVNHGNVVDLRDAAAKSFNAGLDMDMENEAFAPYLALLVESGVVPMTRLDAAVTAVLTAKARLGLLDDPFRYCDEAREKATLLQPEFLEAARDLARRSCVLLKNDHAILPLNLDTQSVGLIGPLADSPLHQLGAWHARGEWADSVTLRTELSRRLAPGKLRFAQGCEVWGGETAGFASARRVAEDSDVVVMVLGEDSDQSGEANSRAFLDLSGPQIALLKEVHAAGKPIVLVLMTGRPLMLEALQPYVDAIVVAWHPGTMAGPALADVLSGAYNPSGHLPLTWPRSLGQVPIFYAHKNSGRPKPLRVDDRYYSHYIDSLSTPLYPFGYGLSYTTFSFDQLKLTAPQMNVNGSIGVSVRVQNTGRRAGEEVVQLYIRDRVGSVTRPVRELKGFQKIALKPGEAKDVQFTLTAADLSFWRADMTFGPEPGDFDVYVGNDSDARLAVTFALVK